MLPTLDLDSILKSSKKIVLAVHGTHEHKNGNLKKKTQKTKKTDQKNKVEWKKANYIASDPFLKFQPLKKPTRGVKTLCTFSGSLAHLLIRRS